MVFAIALGGKQKDASPPQRDRRAKKKLKQQTSIEGKNHQHKPSLQGVRKRTAPTERRFRGM